MNHFVIATEERFNKNDTKFNRLMVAATITLQRHDASIHKLETMIGQLANIVANKQHGSLLSNTERNPREEVKAITLRTRKELREPEFGEKQKGVK